MTLDLEVIIRYLISMTLIGAVFTAPVAKPPESQPVPLADPKPGNKDLENITLPESFRFMKNYETLGGGIEGDMIFPNGYNPHQDPMNRGVATAGFRTWPNNVIPYDLSAIRSSAHRDFILRAMEKLMYDVGTPTPGGRSRTACVYFRPRTSTDRNYVRITYGQGCSGTVGYWPSSDMVITLANPGCFTSGIIQHELIHVLGFYHEQSRPDRDSYISVYYNNIEPYARYNFDKLQWGRTATNQNTPYDLQSIMHYDAFAFSRNGRPTIVPRQSNLGIGQRERLSSTDIAEIRKYYSCS